jgi:hypothetical protein
MISIIEEVTIGETADAMTIGTLAAIRRKDKAKMTDTVVDIKLVSNSKQVATAVVIGSRTMKEEAVMRDRVLMIGCRLGIGSVVDTTIGTAGEVVLITEVENMAISMGTGEQRGEVGLQLSSKAEIITAGTPENQRS